MDTALRPDSDVRHEYLRIAGKKVETGARLEVRFPWDNRLVGTVPRATPELVAQAFQIAHDYKPKLTRYQRQKILLKTADLLVARKEELSRLITLESGLCLKDLRMYDTPKEEVCKIDGGCEVTCIQQPGETTWKIKSIERNMAMGTALAGTLHFGSSTAWTPADLKWDDTSYASLEGACAYAASRLSEVR